jgi:hypothetical protein
MTPPALIPPRRGFPLLLQDSYPTIPDHHEKGAAVSTLYIGNPHVTNSWVSDSIYKSSFLPFPTQKDSHSGAIIRAGLALTPQLSHPTSAWVFHVGFSFTGTTIKRSGIWGMEIKSGKKKQSAQGFVTKMKGPVEALLYHWGYNPQKPCKMLFDLSLVREERTNLFRTLVSLRSKIHFFSCALLDCIFVSKC